MYNRADLAIVLEPILLHACNPGPLTGAGNNTYLIVGAHRSATLVDAGQGQEEHLQRLADELDRHGARLDRVLVTHAHPDHIAGAPQLAAAYPSAAFYKWPRPGDDEQYPAPWRPLDDEQRIDVDGDELVAIHTPGHAPDDVVFWHEPSGGVFAGDLVFAGGSVSIHASRGGDLQEYLAALQRVRALEPALLWPAHGDIVPDAAALLTRVIEHRLSREAQIVQAVGAGRATVQAIAEFIYDGLNPALLPAAHDTVRAHLEKLRREERVVAVDDRWSASGPRSEE